MSSKTSPTSSIFGSHTFSLKIMRDKLPKNVFHSLKRTMERSERLQPEIAEVVAQAMKDWAIEHGATHYCHWFQPMTGSTAEKHDAFLSFDRDGTPVDRFSGSQLIQGEPDASSFPSGGMRSTFEARGYTAWDPSSPAFLMQGAAGLTLCIPTVFMSYHGEALDEKTPLLRSMEALSQAALRMLHLLGATHAQKVTTTLGPEQEYFLIDRKFLTHRPDLVLCGRTLLGAQPPKGQQLEDHYFGSIPDRVLAFMQDVEKELYLLGIPAKTRHNEVAPRQFEIAPIFEETHLAADHNLLVMEVMRRVALRHEFVLLLHEKPFAGINGSGKHNNWSMADDQGNNLLDPGHTPHDNLQFLVFLVATLKAVHRRAALLRTSIASAGNDHRLGANEAPPAIMSVFLGEQLDRILNAIDAGEVTQATATQMLHLGVSSLPEVLRDNTDRNRTSPFAFTGNKFEFRAVPSSMPVAMPNVVLNTAVAEALTEMCENLEARMRTGGADTAVLELLREEIRATRAIRFEGDGYSPDWQELAARRGLPNLKSTPEALLTWRDPGNRQIFERFRVLSDAEIESRLLVRLEQYVKQIDIEGKTLGSMLRTQVIPACMGHQSILAESVLRLRALAPFSSAEQDELLGPQRELVGTLARHLSALISATQDLEAVVAQIHHAGGPEEQAGYCATHVLSAMQAARAIADRLESLVDSRVWPMPTYCEMLFHS